MERPGRHAGAEQISGMENRNALGARRALQLCDVGKYCAVTGDEIALVPPMLLLEIDEERCGFAPVEGKRPPHPDPRVMAASWR